MRIFLAVLLAIIGLLGAVGIPIILALRSQGPQNPGGFLAGMLPGIVLIGIAHKVWRSQKVKMPNPEHIPDGKWACEACGTIVETSDLASFAPGVSPTNQRFKICKKCGSQRSKRALKILAIFLIVLLLMALEMQIVIRTK